MYYNSTLKTSKIHPTFPSIYPIVGSDNETANPLIKMVK